MASSSSLTKRCHYEVLDLSQDSSPEEIRSSYRRLALQRHPDKLIKSGLSQEEATAQFQELQHAYEVLSDPKERAWYDSHRSQILFSDPNSLSKSVVPDLFSFFSNTVYSGYSDTGKGFYKVYSDVFDKIHANEINFARKMGLGVDAVRQAPVMGNLDSPYAQVTAFYGYWLGFCTVMDFCWADEYDAMAGPNRKSRRLMEEENNKARRKAKKEYNDTVRRLGDFVKKRDKRVIDMRVKKSVEMERKKEEEREKKKRLEKEKKERAMAYEEPDWAKVEEEEVVEEWVEEGEEEKKNDKEFYCVLCGKKFKSEKQWKNHEQSKKHKERVAEFRDSIGDEEDLEEGKEGLGSEEDGVGVDGDGGHGVGDLEARIRDGLNVEEGVIKNGGESDDDDDGGGDEFYDASHVKEGEDSNGSVNLDDSGNEDDDNDENGVLEAMVAGHKNRKPRASTHKSKAAIAQSQIETEEDEFGPMEYSNRKSTRKKRRAKKEKGRENWEESQGNAGSCNDENINGNGNDNSRAEESCSQHFVENGDNIIGNEQQVSRGNKISNQPADTKGAGKDTKIKAKISSKGRKAKVTSKNVGNTCDACGEEFDSRNKLHKHLGDSGHATIIRGR
ncbi:DNAJ protein JJJ1 homolog [Vigna unguiculata]|uniref:DnaJ-like protein subfamily A member 5 n=1 Tax=Vigna unguiculata TaxID=3917 RepID=A0A4D6KWR7_VIGUN|nr:DNAJ protein JJJ1 homolog [Vigna unguiculata]QCD80815.1 DnaJ-like protein subfamily A member 5 [Vigna unguiculata]